MRQRVLLEKITAGVKVVIALQLTHLLGTDFEHQQALSDELLFA